MNARLALGLAAFAAVSVPFWAGSYVMHVLVLVAYFAYVGTCWNLLGGFAGQVSLGHALFISAGAYTSTLLFLRAGVSPWVGMLIGGVIAAGLGLAIGYACFRYQVRGIFFMLVTLVFVEIARSLAVNLPALGGARGLRILTSPDASAWTMQFATKTGFYYTILAFLALALAVAWGITRSRVGYYFTAIREDEEAAAAVGVPLMRYKLLAVALSAFLTAWGGTFIAQYVTYIDPFTVLTFGLSIEILIYAVAGGMGRVLGAVAGAVVLVPSAEVVRAVLGTAYQGVHLMVYGAILMLVVALAPEGIVGRLSARRRSAT